MLTAFSLLARVLPPRVDGSEGVAGLWAAPAAGRPGVWPGPRCPVQRRSVTGDWEPPPHPPLASTVLQIDDI